MSIEKLEELKAIDADAPDDASNVDAEGYYIKFSNGSYYCCASKLDSWRRIEKSELLTTRSLSDIKRIIELMEIESDIRAALKSANIQNRKLLDKTNNLKEKIKDIGYSYRRVEQERDELRILKFKKFNDEECWLYQGDGNDYLESLVCPVVISPEKLIDIINGDL